jgi:amino acid transporter
VLQTVVTLAILVGGVALVLGGVTLGDGAHLEPLFVGGVAGLFGVLIMTPFMFVGFDVIPQAAEEIDLPAKQIGKVLILSVGMAVAWYILVILAASLALDAQGLAGASLATADAMTALLGHPIGGTLIVIAGLGGIITSWNAFYIGGSRAIYAMAKAHMLPHFLAKLHPKYGTPVNAILLIAVLSTAAPLLGRRALVWLVDAGGLGIVIAYGTVAASFLMLRKREPSMPRPFRVANGEAVGWGAAILAFLIAILYLPPSPAALVWPYEWAIVGVWVILGIAFYAWAITRHGEEAHRIIDAELRAGHTDTVDDEAVAVAPAK